MEGPSIYPSKGYGLKTGGGDPKKTTKEIPPHSVSSILRPTNENPRGKGGENNYLGGGNTQ